MSPEAPSLRAGDPRPLRRDAERNRQRILDAARRLFTERGLDVSHDEIADAAEVGVGTVYRRFPDRESLIDALFTEQVDEVVASARAAAQIADPWDALVSFFTEALTQQSCNRGLKELTMGTSRGSRLVAHAQQQIAPVVEELVLRAQRSGQLRADVGVQDIALVPLMVGAVMDGARDVAPDLWQRVLAMTLEGLKARPDLSPLPGDPPTAEQHEKIMTSWRPPGRRG